MQKHVEAMLEGAKRMMPSPTGVRAAISYIQGWTGEAHRTGQKVVYTSEDVCEIMEFLLKEGEENE